MSERVLAATVMAALITAAPAAAPAQTLRVGLSSEPTAIDPHYHSVGPNNALFRHIFDTLVRQDAEQKVGPGLARSWENRDDRTWVFRLRDDVKFTNGQPFTVQDVIFSFCRVLNNETSVTASFTDAAKNMEKVEAEGDHTVVITTKQPEALLLTELATVAMISKDLVKADSLRFDPKNGCGVTSPWPTVSQFNDGAAAIGTGAYKLKSYIKGGAIELTRNDAHWGEKAPWSEVRFVPVPNAGPRLAGLLAGDFDVIENPAARDLGRIRDNPKFGHVVTPSTRVMFLQMDTARDQPPGVRSDKGNPFKDPRVRLAVSKAIDRKAIVQRIMDGAAVPADQYLPTGMSGTMPDPKPLDYDPKAARALLAEAGYPNGFGVTLYATNDRYINDSQIAQVIAGFLTQIGIKTEVDAMTRTIFFGRRAKKEFGFSMAGWGSTSGEATGFLRQWVTTQNKDIGVGESNYGGYSNPAVDEPLLKAIRTVKEDERDVHLRQAGRAALEGLGLIPIHFESSIWAFRKGLAYKGRADQYTLAMEIKPAS